MARGWRGAFMSMFGDGEWRLEVVAVTDVTPRYRRLTFHAPGFFEGKGAALGELSAASWIRLWVPELERPERESQRAYTVLDPDVAAERLSLEFVLHEPGGPASTWAARAQVGDAIQATRWGLQRFTPPEPPAAGYVLCGDASALPAINGILGVLPQDVPVHVYLQEADPSDRDLPVTEHPGRRLTWVAGPGATALAGALEPRDYTGWFAWVGAERDATKVLRGRLGELGFEGTALKAQAYWVRGEEMGISRGEEEAVEVPVAGGRVLRGRRRGSGGPVVVFETGLGNTSWVWAKVVAEVSRVTTTVVYDRAGLGESDPAPPEDDRGFRAQAADLNALLDALGDGPFVLVGHSAGGIVARLAAAERPERIAGLVLADPAQEQADGYFSRWFEPTARAFYGFRLALARAGLLRRMVHVGVRSKLGAAADAYATAESRPSAVRAARREFDAFVPSLRELREAPEPPHQMPVVMVSGGRTGLRHGAERPAVTAAHRAWVEAQPQGRYVTADCGHLVPLDAPAELSAAILTLVR